MFSAQATLTLGVPYGYTMHIKIPGYASSAQARSHISLTYLEQFAVFDPPAHQGQPQVVGVSAAPVSAS